MSMSLLGFHFQDRYWVRTVIVVFLFLAMMAGYSSQASASTAQPAWQVTDVASPTVLTPSTHRARYNIVVENIGGQTTSGDFTVHVGIPSRFTVPSTRMEPSGVCLEEEPGSLSCTSSEPVVPDGFATVLVELTVAGSSGSLDSVVSVTGGGAAEAASDQARMSLGSERAAPGIAFFRSTVTGARGEPVTQAGAHPTFLTTTLLLNNVFEEASTEQIKPVELPKDLVFYLPLGMLGDPAITTPCHASSVEVRFEQSGCPQASRVGSILPMLLDNVFADSGDPTRGRGIYSVQPEKGYAAEFAFASLHLTFFVYASVVRRDGTYMLRVSTPGVPPSGYLFGLVASFFGDITEEGDSIDRGAFLSNPMDCEESAMEPRVRESSAIVNTWEHPYPLPVAEKVPGFSSSSPAFSAIDGCGLLNFGADVGVRPSTTQADEPSGYEVGLDVPQSPDDFGGLATPPVKNVSVTLPPGTSISPSSANGLVACPETGAHGINIEGPESEEIAPDGLERPAIGHCPDSSAIATVTATTPLLHEALGGHLYLASPDCGGSGQSECTAEDARDGGLFRLYLELDGPNSGVIVKLKGSAMVDPNTGRITTVFDKGPQFPFSNLTVSTKAGPTASLDNSQACGAAVTHGEVTPWSAPATPTATSQSAFGVDWDGAGGACPGTAPFAPSFTAGTTSPLAASTSPFTLLLKREDREQDISTLTTTLPEGLLADVAKATKCPEPQASTASLSACPAASQIGTTTVAVGPGPSPYYETGKVFFTGPYGGAPFGLSVVVPAVAGPFNLGNVLVRAALFVDPHTAQATAVSGPLPQILDGVPLRLRTLNVTLTDREFVLNPTSCQPTSISATVQSTAGGSTTLSSPFAVKGCRNLPFKPTLSGSTEAKATKAEGAGVKIKLSYPAGGEANIAKVALTFPKQLPVRLETLQKACRSVVFEANPANCPAASAVGVATVHTPILAQPLSGPAYLVSYGGAKFPDVVFVLQGEGVTLEVDGQSQVSQSGILKVTFTSVPDAPFSTFESVLPRGPFSQFTSSRTTGRAQASQCGENLVAPVTITAHNGAQLTQNATLTIAGCGPSVSIVKARGKANGLSLAVQTSAPGRLTIEGRGLKPLARSGLGAGVHTVLVSLTNAGRRIARQHRAVQVNVGLQVGKRKASAQKRVAL